MIVVCTPCLAKPKKRDAYMKGQSGVYVPIIEATTVIHHPDGRIEVRVASQPLRRA